MAYAVTNTKKKIEIVEVVEDDETIVLELNRKEATFLKFVLDHIGGAPQESPRMFSARIKTALLEAGFAANTKSYGLTSSCLERSPAVNGSLHFKDSFEHEYLNKLLLKED